MDGWMAMAMAMEMASKVRETAGSNSSVANYLQSTSQMLINAGTLFPYPASLSRASSTV
jgi:hypothetical protein